MNCVWCGEPVEEGGYKMLNFLGRQYPLCLDDFLLARQLFVNLSNIKATLAQAGINVGVNAADLNRHKGEAHE